MKLRKVTATLLLYCFGLDAAVLPAVPRATREAFTEPSPQSAPPPDPTPFDLRTWSVEGRPGAGEWEVSPDGAAVSQRIEGGASFFVSPEALVNATLRGRLTIAAPGSGLVGFVLGYRSPLAADGDEPEASDFLLLDWTASGNPSEGFTLSRVQGTLPDPPHTLRHHLAGPALQVLATSVGPGKGWVPGREYPFEIAYRKSRIRVSIDGQTVLDKTGAFLEGRLGAYALAQRDVRFSGLAAEAGNGAPVADAGSDRNLDAGTGCAATVTLDGSGSSDPDGDILGYAWSGPFGVAHGVKPTVSVPVGMHRVTLTVDDGNGATDSAQLVVSVEDRQPPVLACPAPLTVTSEPGQCQAPGVILEPPAVADNCAVAGLTSNAPGSFPHGTTQVRWTATDSSGYLASCIQSVVVDDATAPVVQATVDRAMLWPPNHALIDVGLHAHATDTCGDQPALAVKVFSDEPDEDQTGDGNFFPDAQIVNGTLALRAERKGDANGRVYLVIVSATDPAGNVGHACPTVVVPHSQNKADLDAVSAQAGAAQQHCQANGNAPASYSLIAEGALTRVNRAPFVDAGPDRTIVLPTDTVTLVGTATDDGLPAGSALAVSWTKLSGPGTVVFGSPHATTTIATFDAAGLYVLRLSATDSELSASADVSVNVIQVNRPPAASAGPDQMVVPPADTVSLSGVVADDGLPAGALTASWTKVSGTGEVVFANPAAAQTTATFTAEGVYVLRLTASDGELQASDDVTVAVDSVLLSLEPSRAGPNVRGTSQSLKATLKGRSGGPMAGVALDFAVTGPNAQTGTATTGADGVATFAYVGETVGTDTVQASAPAPEAAESNPATVSWIAPSQPVGTTTVLGRFFAADGTGVFNTPTDEVPVFSQTFPVLLFNPPVGVLGGSPPGVNETTRPFTDVVTDGAGNVSGTIVAAGNGLRAGADALGSFSAVFTGQLVVAAAGDVTFTFHSADGFVFGVGGGASRVSGTLTNPPPSGRTPFEGLAVMGTANVAGDLLTSTATVHFPAPGLYPYEVDYAEGLGDPLSLAMTFDGHGVPPAGSLVLSPAAPAPQLIGEQQTLTVQGLDGTGGPVAGLPVQLVLTGAHSLRLHAVADAVGVATFTYTGTIPGVDSAQATALITGMVAFSNIVSLAWQDRTNQPPAVSAGADQTLASPADAATLSGSASDDGLPFGSVLTLSWSKVSGPGAVGFADPGSAVTTASFDASGVYVLRLAASDTQLLSTSDVRVTVGPNQPPVITTDASATADLASPLTLHATVEDDGLPVGGTLTNTWSQVSGPGTATFRRGYSVVGDFVVAANPSGAWSYGWTNTRGSAFIPFTVSQSAYAGVPGWSRLAPGPGVFPANYPVLAYNGTGQPISFSGATLPPDLLDLAPGPAGENAVVRWTAPSSGIFLVQGRFQAIQSDTTSDVAVLLNSETTLFDGALNHFGEVTPFIATVTLAAGDTLDFSVGWGISGFLNDSTGLAATITPVNDASTVVTFSASGTYVLRLTASDSELTSSADVTVSVAQSCVAPPPGMVSWWAGEQSAEDLVDGNHGELMGGTTFASGLVGKAFRFDGINGYVKVPRAPNLDMGSAVTLDFWMKADPGNPMDRCCQGLVNTDFYDVEISGGYDPRIGVNFAIRSDTGPIVHSSDLAGGGYPVAPGEWHHVAGVYDGAYVKLFIDGRLVAQTPHAGNISAMLPNSFFSIGSEDGRTNCPSCIQTRYFKGMIDEVHLFDRALTAAEVDAVFAGGTSGACRPGGNQPPVVDAGPPASITLPASTVTLNGTVADDGLPSGTLTVSWSKVSGPGTVTFQPDDQPVTAASFDQAGTYVLRLSASDSELMSGSNVRVTVNPAAGNAAPAVDAGPDQVISLPTNSVTLQGAVADDGIPGGAVTAEWSKVSGPGEVTFDVATFSAAANPNLDCLPAHGWSYGFSQTRGSEFQLLSWVGENDYYGLPSCRHGDVFPDSYPLFAFNTTGETITWSNVVQPADELSMHPGQHGENAVLRWTAPEAGIYRIAGRFEGIALGGSIVDVAILYNSATALLSADIGSFGETRPFSLLRTVAAGDTIDFTVGFGANNNFISDTTGLAVTITRADSAVTTATFSTPGVYVLRLTASDGQLSSTDDITVTLTEPDDPPVVNAGPDQAITLPAHIVVLGGSVTDDGRPPGAPITVGWGQVSGPAPVIFETPLSAVSAVSFSVPGVYVLRLSASDTLRIGSDDVMVTVRPPNRAPIVNAGPDQSITLPTSAASLNGSATDDGEPAGSSVAVSWRVAGGPVDGAVIASPSSGATSVSFAFPGVYVLRFVATDGALAASDDVIVTVGAAPPVGPPPAVDVTAPEEGAVVTTPIDIVGSVASGSLLGWRLEYRRDGDSTWTRFASGASPASGVLSRFDPTLLLNGLYEVRLLANDTAGRSQGVSFHAVVRDNQKVGHFTVSFVDLEVPVAGLPIRVTRIYDSRDKGVGDFGFGWRLDLSSVRLGKSGVAGLSWFGTASAGPFPTYCLQPTRPSVVTVTMPDGRVYEFESTLSRSCQFALPLQETTVGFQPRPGTVASLAPMDGGDVFAVGSWPGPVQLYSAVDFSLYDPTLYRLTLPDGRAFVVDQQRGVQSLRDLNGNTLTVGPGGITHSSGKGVVFVRDGQGRITSITDPSGNDMSYGYDPSGDLTAYTDRESHATTFTYESAFPHHLKEIKDPLGRAPIRNEYYDDGRLKSHTDAFGKTITYVHDLSGRQEVVIDRDGGVRVLGYDERGNVVKEVDPAGKQVLRTFDERNNRLSETLPHEPGTANPPTTTYVYDASDSVLSVTDPLSQTTSYTYNARKQVVSARDARGNATVNVYDTAGNLLSTADAAGQATSYTYDARGNVLTQTDAQSGVTRYEYDAFGRVTKETDALTHKTSYTYDGNGNRLSQTTTRTAPAGTETLVTSYEYDRQGRLTKTTDPDGSFTRTVYDELGRQKEAHDKLGRVTAYAYDEMGRLVRTTYADSTFEESTYDGEGRRLTSKDRGGRVTSYLYDAMGRLTKTTFPDTAFTTNTYDDAGRLVSTKDARSNDTRYEYDAAGRRTKVIDAQDHETVFGYDGNGNQTSVKDPRGNTTRYEYDALNRRVKTIFPDDSFTLTGYDALGRRTSETDQAGKVTRFGYDKLGRLTSVTDALNQVTSYGYDEVGNRTSQKDANLHITGFEYGKLGRETARILPDGKREIREYDAAGNLRTRTDFMGRLTTYDYDQNNRLLSRGYPDTAQDVSFTYTATGRRRTATDSRGTTNYDYDLRDRLTTRIYSDGRKLEYTHDAQGNQTKLTAVLGATSLATDYTFDSLNRLETATDPQSRTYSYTYDRNGNRESLAQPNGTVTGYSYDLLNRLKTLATTHPASGRTIQSYTYTLGPSGNRTAIAEADGTLNTYAYDALYRLTGEKVTVNNLLQYEKVFGYDPVGNRLSQTTTGSGAPGTPTAPGTISYGYDERDRLLSENATTYGYDDNGSLLTKSAEATYVWDFENRLIKVTKTNGTVVAHAYDADGNRVQTKFSPTTGPPSTTNFLVDTSGQLSHVVAETDAAGVLNAHYIRGDDLLAVMRPSGPGAWSTRFYHADGLGSVRRLTDETGNITDGYAYTAFGESLGHTGTDPQPYAFTGEPYDPNVGFQYHRARWMDPRTGRLLGMDPFRGQIFKPLTLHRYLYAGAAPVNNVDPSGEFDSGSQLAGVLGANTIRATSTITFGKVLLAVGLVGVAGGQILGPLAALREIKERGVPTDLYAFGNRAAPRGPRPSDFNLPDDSGTVGPETRPLPKGASTFGDPSVAPLTGHYHGIPRGILVPPGLAVAADGPEVVEGSPHPATHHTIYPVVAMPFGRFVEKFFELPWEYAGKK
jgi:RHS repeat-associated protein